MHVIRNRDPWRINIIPKEGARWKLRNGDIHEILASAIISWMIAEPTEWRNIRIQVRGGGTQAAHLCPSPFDPRSRMRTGEGEEGGFWEDSKEAKRNARPRNPGRAIPESRNANSTGILNGRYSTVAFPVMHGRVCAAIWGCCAPACFCWQNENAVEPWPHRSKTGLKLLLRDRTHAQLCCMNDSMNGAIYKIFNICLHF